MRRYKTNGKHIKELRERREHRATQKEFAHEVRISERLLREIENRNGEITIDLVERIARALAVPRQAIISACAQSWLGASAGCEPSGQYPVSEESGIRLVPRFDTQTASVVRDESDLFETARDSHVIVSHLMTKLTRETQSYAEEMLDLLESVSWERRHPLKPVAGRDELRVRGRLQELLVLLKGNDVWVYVLTHIKKLPESDAVIAERDGRQLQTQAVVAFGPPGEYGEDSVHVPVDHGQPWIYDPNEKLS